MIYFENVYKDSNFSESSNYPDSLRVCQFYKFSSASDNTSSLKLDFFQLITLLFCTVVHIISAYYYTKVYCFKRFPVDCKFNILRRLILDQAFCKCGLMKIVQTFCLSGHCTVLFLLPGVVYIYGYLLVLSKHQ